MKPNFALSLSFEGIRLLHRLGAGWNLVGEVALDAPDLAHQLAVLRKTGLALDPQGLRTKLLIPNDQIKYLALDTTRAQDDDVRRALDGVTPYPVDDLVYDYVRGGGRTYVAAVARETLAEAEAFAAEHRFGPVCFASVPDPFTYVGEAFFGPTSAAARLIGTDQTVERDALPVAWQPNPRGPGAKLPDPGSRQTDPVKTPALPPAQSADASELGAVLPGAGLPRAVLAGAVLAGAVLPGAGLADVPEPAAPLILTGPDLGPQRPAAPAFNPDAPPVPETGAVEPPAAQSDSSSLQTDHAEPNLEAPDQARLDRAEPDPVPELAIPDPDPIVPAGPPPQIPTDPKPMSALARAIRATAAPVDFAPRYPTIFDSATAISLALPNLPGQSLDEDQDPAPVPFQSRPAAAKAAPATVVLPQPEPSPDLAPDLTGPIVAAAQAAGSPRPSLVPEPVFASRARPLRADGSEFPPAARPLAAPPGSRTPRGDDRAEPVFSRRSEPPVMKPPVPAMPTLPPPAVAKPAVAEPAVPQPAVTQSALAVPAMNGAAMAAMATPRLTGAARTPADPAPGQPRSGRPFSARPGGGSLADPTLTQAITGQSGAVRPAAAVAATVIPFRPGADQTGPAATPVSIETVTLTPAKAPGSMLAKARAKTPAGLAPAQPAAGPPLRPGASGYFASRHGKPADQPGTAADQVLFRDRAQIGGKPRYLALILTLILLACLAAVAAWATFISETGIAGLFGLGSDTEVAVAADPVGQTPAGSVPAHDITATALAAHGAGPDLGPGAAAVVARPGVAEVPDLAAADPAPAVTAPDPTGAALVDPAPPATVTPETVTPETATAATVPGTVLSPAEADRIYAATGVWLRAPRLPLIPTADPVGALSLAALDNGTDRLSLPAMPPLSAASPDQPILPQLDPPAPGTVFARDARGFVLATPEGTLTPDGILVFAGLPAIIPPTRPGTPVPEAGPAVVAAITPDPAPGEVIPGEVIPIAAPPLAPRDAIPPAALSDELAPGLVPGLIGDPATAGAVGLASLRPLLRPAALVPAAAPQATLVAFDGPRPPLRPQGLTPEAAPDAVAEAVAASALLPETAPATAPGDPSLAVADTVAAILAAAPPDPAATATPLAIASARVPESRPQNFAQVVASAQERSAAAPQTASLAVIEPQAETAPVTIAPETVAPSGPVSGGLATAATLEQAIDLREVNLIGVFGRPNDRRALVRLANGRYVRVGVGDSLDGGQVAAIGDNALNYVKRGQTITIAIPNG